VARVAVNGLGRIGRAAFKIILATPELELIAVNDIVPAENLAYLLQYDTAYGRYEKTVAAEDDRLIVDGVSYQVYREKDPAQLPWGDLDIDIVFECTGFFTRKEDLQRHLQAGAKYAILSAPSKGEGMPTVVHGVSVPKDDSVRMISCGSCTTNCITPVVEVMGRRIGIEKAIMTTIHAYTSSQGIVDGPSKKVRRGRAGAANFVPTSTGAAIATTLVMPRYKGIFDGVAVRGPVPVGSIADIVFLTSRDTTAKEVNEVFREESESDRYRGVLAVTNDPIVSSDIIGDPHASIIDLGMTTVVAGNLVKVMSWYDNEWGFTSQMVREGVRLAKAKSL
jgi:glyceraldehyde 3-phosphate dehydrogenase